MGLDKDRKFVANSAMVSFPKAEVEFITETGNLVARGVAISADDIASDNVHSDIVNIRTKRDLGVDSPTFSVNLVYRNDWFYKIASNDMVVISMCRPPEKMTKVFVGLVDDVRKSVDVSGGKPQRVISVTGRGMSKAFLNFEVGIIAEREITEGTLGWLGREVTLQDLDAAKAIDTLINQYMKKYMNYKFSDGSTLWTTMTTDLKAQPQYKLIDVSNVVMYQGAIWNLMKELQNAPFNEMFWEMKSEKPNLTLRPTPFNKSEWNSLPSEKIADIDVVTPLIGRSDVETYTLYSVGCKTWISAFDQTATLGYAPLWYKPYKDKYGIKRLHVVSMYAMYSGEDDIEVAGDVTREYTVDLYNWNIKNNSMYNGNIIVRGSNRFKIGTRLDYADEGLEFYVEGVSHDFSMYGSFITQLSVTRGLPKEQRFASPWDSYTAFVPEEIGMSNMEESGFTSDFQSNGYLQDVVGGEVLDSMTVTKFIASARSRVGMKYVWGATGPNEFDCSGLVKWSLAQAGYTAIPRTSKEQYKHCTPITRDELQPGDLVFRSKSIRSSDIHHVGIYAGNGMVIEAPNASKPLREIKMGDNWQFFGRIPMSR